MPWSPQRSASTYARLGAYEASKVESDAVVQASARALGVPLTIANVDFLARFMVLLPCLDETEGEAYWILDDGTPLPALLRLIGTHRGVRVPRARIPVGLIRRLPVALTHADPETLSFLSTDRYPTRPADELARAHGLKHPNVVVSLQRWCDHLAGMAAS